MPRGSAPSKVDKNHALIVLTLRACGYHVLDLHTVGCGCPDILVVSKADSARVMLMEIKSCGGKLTDDEKIFFSVYPGRATIAVSPERAIELMEQFDLEAQE
jgi:hypothetical protein